MDILDDPPFQSLDLNFTAPIPLPYYQMPGENDYPPQNPYKLCLLQKKCWLNIFPHKTGYILTVLKFDIRQQAL